MLHVEGLERQAAAPRRIAVASQAEPAHRNGVFLAAALHTRARRGRGSGSGGGAHRGLTRALRETGFGGHRIQYGDGHQEERVFLHRIIPGPVDFMGYAEPTEGSAA